MVQRTRAQRLNGLFPLSYVGVVPVSPPNFIMDDRAPTINDSKNFYIGDLWLDTSTQPPLASDLWMLVSLAGNVATWVNFGAGNVESLTGNSGGPVFPDGADNINVIGDGTTVNVVGNPGTNTLTISAVGTGLVSSLTGNSGGAVFPLAGNINTVGDGTTITIVGNPGTHTLTASTVGTGVMSSLTGDSGGPVFPLAGNTNIFGTASVITVTGNPGTHTLTINAGSAIATSYITSPATGTAVPAAGVLTFAGTGGTTVSAAGSTVTINSSGSDVTGLLADDGNTVTPTAGVIKVAGGSNITTTGTVGPNTLTIHYSPTSSFTATWNTETNITGDGTIAQLGATAAATVLTNVGSNFYPGSGAGAGATYTAPVTGLYFFNMYANFTVSASATAGIDFSIGTSGSLGYNVSIGPTKNSVPGYNNFAGDINVGGGFVTQLTAGDVLTFTAQSNGTAKVTTVTFGTVGGYLIN